MKRLLTLIVVMLLPTLVLGQQAKKRQPLPLAKFGENVKLPLTSKERAQIIEVYGDAADKLVFNNEHRLKSIKNILRNRVIVKLITDSDMKKECPKLSEAAVFDNVFYPEKHGPFNPDDFNPLKYNFEFYSKSAFIYQVDNTNYYILIKSQYQ